MTDVQSSLSGRLVFDISSLVRWSGPPVGIVRVQRELALWARRRIPGVRFAIFDPASMAFRHAAPRYLDDLLSGAASLNAWALPDASGGRTRRSARVPPALYSIIQTRRTLLRVLERARLGSPDTRVARIAEHVQRGLISPRYAAAMLNPDGSRRAFLTPDMAFSDPVSFAAGDVLASVGFGWSHTNIDAVAKIKAEAGVRIALMCYDVMPLMFEEFFKAKDVESFRRYWKVAFPAADLTVVNSAVVAKDVVSYCASVGLSVRPPVVCPLGANLAVEQSARSGPLPADLERGRYALFVSTIEPRKGHEFLYRVWLRLIEGKIPQEHAFKLAFVGRTGWMTDEFVAAVKTDDRLCGSIQFLDHVEDDQLELLYDNAAFCVYPSVYEGYGLPIVEAFARGKAVIASSGGSLPEVVGDLSPTLPPRDADAWQFMLGEWIANPEARRPFERAIEQRFSHPSWNDASERFFRTLAIHLTPAA